MTLQEMKKRKQELGYSNETLADMSGLPLGTVQKVMAGVTRRPRQKTLEALARVLEEKTEPYRYSPVMHSPSSVKDTDQIIAEMTGAPSDAVRRILSGKPEPSDRAYLPVMERVLGNGKSCGDEREHMKKGAPSLVREELSYHWREVDDRDPSGGTDPRQGSYTVDDYLAIPDDRRVELIDGFIYDMASPSLLHQAILRELAVQFYFCLEKHPECELFFAPSDVELGRNRRTVVQPDLYILCEQNRNESDRKHVVPDFILEVVSPFNPENDKFRKLNKYRFSGVREYWIVDPQTMKITVYYLEKNMDPEVHDFTDTVSVGISGGTCSIDFRTVYRKVQRHFQETQRMQGT